MTDSLTPDDIERIEDSIDFQDIKEEKELAKKLKGKYKKGKMKGKKIYPDKLKKFLTKKWQEFNIPENLRKAARKAAIEKGLKDFTTTFAKRKNKDAFFFRDSKGRFKGWGTLKE